MNVLRLLSLTDRYERKARLLPALLAAAPALSGVAAVSASGAGILGSLAIGTGLGAVIAVGLSHLASAAGHRCEAVLCRRWGALPTELWLLPENTACSTQQKQQWYAAIKKTTGLDIARAVADGDEEEARRTIRDAVKQLRHRFRSVPGAGLLQTHNEDYGFARNFAGLIWVWGPLAVLSAMVSWWMWLRHDGLLGWAIASSVVLAVALVVLGLLPGYLRAKADRYAESFFGTLAAEAGVERMRTRAASTPGRLPEQEGNAADKHSGEAGATTGARS